MKKVIITIVVISIVVSVVIIVLVVSGSRLANKQQEYPSEDHLNEMTQQKTPTKSVDDENTIKVQDNATKETEPTQFLTAGMMLHATGTVVEVISDTGGDPTSTQPAELIISLDNVKGAVRVLDRGCIEKNIRTGDKVRVSGTIVKVIPDIGIILTCEQGANVKRLD